MRWRRAPFGSRRVVAGSVALLAMFAAAPAAGQQDRYDEGILEVVAERLPPITIVVLIDGAGDVLLPVTRITTYLGLTPDHDGTRISVPRLTGGNATLDAEAATLVLGPDTVELAPAEVVVSDDIYLRVARLEQMLEAYATLDLSRLTLLLVRDVPFPAQQHVMAEQRRALLLVRDRAPPASVGPVGYPASSGGAIVDWDLATSGLDPRRATTLRTEIGVAALGGDLTTAMTVGTRDRTRDGLDDLSVRYQRVFPQGTWLTQLRAGDIVTAGLFSRFVRGIEVGNRPYQRSPEHSDVLIRPDLPAGWQYEVFQGNQLIGYSETGSDAPIAVPLRTGSTPVHVRMYGPAGEEVLQTLLYQAPASVLRQGAAEWAAGIGTCESYTCQRFAHTDLRFGATRRLTVGGGFELFVDRESDFWRPYFVTNFTTGVTATGEVTLMPDALYGATVTVFPREGSTARVRAHLSRPGFGPLSALSGDGRRWDAEATWHERTVQYDLPFSQIRLGAGASGIAGGLDWWRLSATAGVSLGYAELRYEHNRDARHPHLLLGRGSLVRMVGFRGRTFRPLISASLGVGDIGFRLAELGVSAQPSDHAAVSTGLQWSRGNRRPALNFGVTLRTGSATASVRAVTSPEGGGSSAATLSGSAAISRTGAISTNPIPRTGYAGVEGTVFVDRDGNGEYNDGDDVVPGANVMVGIMPATADDRGRYAVWGLQPYTPVSIALDSIRSADPAWTTARPALLLRPTPNMTRTADIALIRTRELVGAVMGETGVVTVGSLTLEITDLESGAITTTTTFSDGQYYMSRIRPGRYRLAVSQASLDAIGAAMRVQGLEFTVPSAGDEVVVELPDLHLYVR